jgi:hypothetical protein
VIGRARHDVHPDEIALPHRHRLADRQEGLRPPDGVVRQRRVRHPDALGQRALEPAGEAVDRAVAADAQFGVPGQELGVVRLQVDLAEDGGIGEDVLACQAHRMLAVARMAVEPVVFRRHGLAPPAASELGAFCRTDRGGLQPEPGGDQFAARLEAPAGVGEELDHAVVEAEVADVVADHGIDALRQFDAAGLAAQADGALAVAGPGEGLARHLEHGAVVDSVDLAGAGLQAEQAEDAGAAAEVGHLGTVSNYFGNSSFK